MHFSPFYSFFFFPFSAVVSKGLFLAQAISVKLGSSELQLRSESKWPKWKGVGAELM